MKPVELYPPLTRHHLLDTLHDRIVGHSLMPPWAAHKTNEIWRKADFPARWLPCDCAPQPAPKPERISK